MMCSFSSGYPAVIRPFGRVHQQVLVFLLFCVVGGPLLVTSSPAQASYLNPALLSVTAQVTDLATTTVGTFGSRDPTQVQIALAFSLFSTPKLPYQFAEDVTISCAGDYPNATALIYKAGWYVGTLRHGQHFQNNLPNYYMCQLAIKNGPMYQVARIPVVDPLRIFQPTAGANRGIGLDVVTNFVDASWPTLWDRVDPHYQFEHTDLVAITQQQPSGIFIIANLVATAGTHTEEPISVRVPTVVNPPLLSSTPGTVDFITRYESTDETLGPTDFGRLSWQSDAVGEVPITWL